MTNTATPSPQAAVHGSDIEGAQTSVHRVECRDNEGVSACCLGQIEDDGLGVSILLHRDQPPLAAEAALFVAAAGHTGHERSEEHTSELQSLMHISYAVFGLNKK